MPFSKKPNNFDAEIDRLIAQLSELHPSAEEYTVAVRNLEVLTNAKSHFQDKTLDYNQILSAIVNLAGIGMVLKHEHLNVITSKALSFIWKMK